MIKKNVFSKNMKLTLFIVIIVLLNISVVGQTLKNKHGPSLVEDFSSIILLDKTDIIITSIRNSPHEIWNKTYGGNENDFGHYVQQTSDGGYILVGSGHINSQDADVELFKTDIDGNEIWVKTYGGSYSDMGRCVRETSDDGFVIVGYYAHGEEGPYDAWMIKTDEDGDEIWNKTYVGKSTHTYGKNVIELNDGYLIMAQIYDGIDTDIWLIKTDFEGNEQWTEYVGGVAGNDRGNAVIEDSDGNFIIVGDTFSRIFGEQVLLIKTDSSGRSIWRKKLNGLEGFDVVEADDGGYVIAGRQNVCLVKADRDGNELWIQEYDYWGFDKALSVDHASDGGYIVSGLCAVIGEEEADALFIKTDIDGFKEWEMTIGEEGSDSGSCVIQSHDDTYVIAGSTDSFGNAIDVWLIKLATFENNRPNNPIIEGPTTGKPNEIYTYTTSSIDPDGDEIYFKWDWGDGTGSDWLGPFNSSEICEASHSWWRIGLFTIQVKAKDIHGGESDWSELDVSMPVNQQSQHPLFHWLFERFPNAFPILRNLLEL